MYLACQSFEMKMEVTTSVNNLSCILIPYSNINLIVVNCATIQKEIFIQDITNINLDVFITNQLFEVKGSNNTILIAFFVMKYQLCLTPTQKRYAIYGNNSLTVKDLDDKQATFQLKGVMTQPDLTPMSFCPFFFLSFYCLSFFELWLLVSSLVSLTIS